MEDERRHRAGDEILEHRLNQLERRVDDGFKHIDHRLDTLAYVRTETWIEREMARDSALSSMREDIASSRALGMWAVGLVAGLVLTSMVGFLVWMAQGAGG